MSNSHIINSENDDFARSGEKFLGNVGRNF
jgi:hypothetical protein